MTKNLHTPVQKQCFAPLVDSQVRILLLGSLPGDASLAQQQYYAHPQNRFWSLLGEILAEDLPVMPYAARLQCLLRRHIGLWDVLAQAQRSGSLDSQLRDWQGNDLCALLPSLPQLRVIAFNGATAARIGLKQLGPLAQTYRILQLPSSSPAHTLAYTHKLAAWRALAEFCV